ncbi:MAG TPA: galactokinase [Anaerolineales bacterium]|jgi:galactokinase
MLNTQRLVDGFHAHFNGNPAIVVRAPGRVNLIGEHTDYNDGFVLPMAIDRAAWIALRPRTDGRVRIRSLDLGEESAFELGRLEKGTGWVEYIKGVANELQLAGNTLTGWEGVLSGDVPIGSGLSSSAAVELAAARAFAAVSGIEWQPAQMARLAQKAENEWVGVKCGIMDQMVSAAARQGHALFLDCRSLACEHVPIPDEAAVVVMDTATRRGLVDSAYNERRGQCEEAAHFFGVAALRDVSMSDFERRQSGLSDIVRRRARHIISENERVLEAAQALYANELARLGELFNASHESLRDDFEVSSAALDQIVEAAREQPACYGARMTGAGFGGCAVALIERDQAGAFVPAVLTAYRLRSGLEAEIFACKASAGATIESL